MTMFGSQASVELITYKSPRAGLYTNPYPLIIIITPYVIAVTNSLIQKLVRFVGKSVLSKGL